MTLHFLSPVSQGKKNVDEKGQIKHQTMQTTESIPQLTIFFFFVLLLKKISLVSRVELFNTFLSTWIIEAMEHT